MEDKGIITIDPSYGGKDPSALGRDCCKGKNSK